MKKLFLIISAFFLLNALSAQVFNTGQTLKKGVFSAGAEPAIIAGGNADFMLFGHLGYGLKSNIDFGAKVGVLGPGETYLGADIEFGITKNISVSGGAHIDGDFGLDGTLLGTYPISNSVNLYGGLDADIYFSGNTYVPLWIPVGVEVGLKKSFAFILEASVGLTNGASHIIGGGVIAYF